MALWAAAGEHQRGLVAGWNRQGLDWRSWTAAEMTGVLYDQFAEALPPRQRRNLFLLAGDKAAVAALDRETLNQSKTPEFADIPVRSGVRG